MENSKNNSEAWEDEKIEMKRKLFVHVENFLKFDADANGLMLDILKLVKVNFEKNPNAFNSDNNLKELLQEIKAKNAKDTDKGADVKGGDIIGGNALSDIIEFIKSISIDLIAKEKEFFLQIIKLIFCGC